MPLGELVGQRDRQRHEFLGLAAGVAEHQALVAGAALVHAHRNVRRLLVDRRDDRAGLVMEADRRVGVADLLDGLAHDGGDVHVSLGGDLPGHDDDARGDERLAGDARHRVVGEHRVKNCIRNLVGNLVRVAHAHRFGREEMSHARQSFLLSWDERGQGSSRTLPSRP